VTIKKLVDGKVRRLRNPSYRDMEDHVQRINTLPPLFAGAIQGGEALGGWEMLCYGLRSAFFAPIFCTAVFWMASPGFRVTVMASVYVFLKDATL
jgi:hypothetical protein